MILTPAPMIVSSPTMTSPVSSALSSSSALGATCGQLVLVGVQASHLGSSLGDLPVIGTRGWVVSSTA